MRLGLDLGVRVVAEGVETTLQHDVLVAAGCPFAQGYLYGRPMPEAELHHRLVTGTGIGPDGADSEFTRADASQHLGS